MRAMMASFALASVLLGAAAALGFDVTDCAQTVPPGAVGVLQSDLDCAAAPGICFLFASAQPTTDVACTSDADCGGGLDGTGLCNRGAVFLGKGAAIDLNGHALSGAGVVCADRGRCAVDGPGEIATAHGIGIYARGPLRARHVVVHDGSFMGILSLRGNVKLEDVISRDNLSFGVDALAGNVTVRNVAATGNSANGGVTASLAVKGIGLVVNGNLGEGVSARSVAVRDLEANGNGGAGVFAGRISLRDSTLAGNGTRGGGYDIHLANLVPHPTIRLVATTCGKSNAGVCTGD